MKYFKYWVKEDFKIKIDGNIETINILSGSNESKRSASEDAKILANKIEQRISKRKSADEYEVPIKEHVNQIIDDSNVVTICRYGALILNTQQYTFLDLDDYPFDFKDIFRSYKNMSKKERIVHKFLERIDRYPVLGSDFRIYETTKGIRVIGKKYIDPTEKKYFSLMRKLSVDWIYIQLSKKQRCYRARLTPKPYRMKMKTIRVKDPLFCETQEYLDWAREYREHSKKYSVVKLLKTVGKDFGLEPVIKLHDEVCNSYSKSTLA